MKPFIHSLRPSFGVALAPLLAVVACLLWSAPAHAYPWMIRHAYTGCSPCHTDPSGGTLLTNYGRAQAELLLQTPYRQAAAEEPSPSSGFAWGAATPPEWLRLGGYFRGLYLASHTTGSPTSTRWIQMQSDLAADLSVGAFRAGGSLGYQHGDAQRAQITRRSQDNLVSREHWLGVQLDQDQRLLLRAGRIHLPFGVRQVEHTLWVRSITRTDVNDTQQHGVALAFSGDWLRGELMGIAGNFQVNPDRYRDRGYSGFVEATVNDHWTAGLSSLLLYAKADLLTRLETVRQAHGIFTRASPWQPLVVMAEVDATVVYTPLDGNTNTGMVAMAQADEEPVQGFHVIETGELYDDGSWDGNTAYGGWLSLAWFFAPHADVRTDLVARRQGAPGGAINTLSYLAQLHLYL